MNNKFGKFFYIILLSFCVLTVWNVTAIPPQGNFADEDIKTVKSILLSKGIILGEFIANGGNGDVYEATQNEKKLL